MTKAATARKARGRRLVLDIDAGRVVLVDGQIDEGSARIRAVMSVAHPEDLLGRPAEQVGGWIKQEMQRAGVRAAPLIFAVPRSEAIIKSLELPGGGGLREEEVAELVRLQLTRQTALASSACVVDHFVVEGVAGVDAGLARVLAGAVSEERLRWRRGVARGMGVPLVAAELRSSGVCALVATLAPADAASVLAILPGPGAAEIVVMEGGRLVTARGIDVARPAEYSGAYTERLATEASRTWVSSRLERPASERGVVVVLGDDEAARAIADAAAASLELPARVAVPGATLVDGLAALSADERAASLVHAGLLLRAALDEPALNFAAPRKPPDRSAIRRQAVLAGLFGAVVLGGVAWVLATREIDAIKARHSLVMGEGVALKERYDERLVEIATLRHMEAWARPRVDWLAHLTAIEGVTADPPAIVLGGVSGRLEAGVAVKPKSDLADPGSWADTQRATLRLSGQAADREFVAALRTALLARGDYAVVTRGPETDTRFEIDLSTDAATPAETPGTGPGPGATGDGGAP